VTDQGDQFAERQRAIAAMRRDIAERLRSVCAAWPENETTELVERIAEIKYKYEVLLDRDLWVSSKRDTDRVD
jgi:hypothetical protein